MGLFWRGRFVRFLFFLMSVKDRRFQDGVKYKEQAADYRANGDEGNIIRFCRLLTVPEKPERTNRKEKPEDSEYDDSADELYPE